MSSVTPPDGAPLAVLAARGWLGRLRAPAQWRTETMMKAIGIIGVTLAVSTPAAVHAAPSWIRHRVDRIEDRVDRREDRRDRREDRRDRREDVRDRREDIRDARFNGGLRD